jgi:hypothetical protein
MATSRLEERLAALESEVARLREDLECLDRPAQPWWNQIVGTFADDPAFEKASELGRRYRKSLRPKPAPRSKR